MEGIHHGVAGGNSALSLVILEREEQGDRGSGLR